MAKSTQPSYNEIITRIEDILRQIDTQQLDVDVLAGQVKEVRKLVKLAQGKLKRVESDLE